MRARYINALRRFEHVQFFLLLLFLKKHIKSKGMRPPRTVRNRCKPPCALPR
jgi:hypothetical protein